jgi:hypothetical protein
MKSCRRLGKLYIQMRVSKGGPKEKRAVPDKFLMRRTVSFVICAKLLREERGKSLVKGDQVLSVLPTLKLVLSGEVVGKEKGREDQQCSSLPS